MKQKQYIFFICLLSIIHSAASQSVFPVDTTSPAQGVDVWDLVLIQRHIMGIQPLGSPYKIIAADANKSKTVSTMDIVEFRRLILGKCSALPNNTAWLSIPKSFAFSNPANPFSGAFPETIDCLTFPAADQNFVAIKIGDVNNTVALKQPADRPQTFVSWPELKPEKGSVITIPVTYTGVQALDAIQLALRFDTSRLQLIGPSIGDVESFNEECFNLLETQQGDLRVVWLPLADPFERIQPGQVLFYLSFKVLDNVVGTFPMQLSDKLLEGMGWNDAGSEFSLTHQSQVSTPVKTPAVQGLKARVFPNPAGSEASLEVETNAAEPLRMGLYDAFGHQVLFQETLAVAGRQTISLSEFASLPVGVYVWKVYTKRAETQGHIIKL